MERRSFIQALLGGTIFAFLLPRDKVQNTTSVEPVHKIAKTPKFGPRGYRIPFHINAKT